MTFEEAKEIFLNRAIMANGFSDGETWRCAVKKISDMLEDGELQEPKTGHWIYDDEYSDRLDVIYECSCCKRFIIVPYEAKNEVYKNYPYCHCGAKMIESEE